MLPDMRLSTSPLPSPIVGGKGEALNGEEDKESGGINLQDGSEGMLYQIWTGYLSGPSIILDAPNQASSTTIYTGLAKITDLSFTFDNNMNPCASFRENDVPKLLWYDSNIEAQAVDTYDWTSAAVFLDDKRPRQSAVNDILLFYTKDSNLYMRQQRDRFLNEYLMYVDVGWKKISVVGMGKNLRLQIVFN